jgi:hypothetical protein
MILLVLRYTVFFTFKSNLNRGRDWSGLVTLTITIHCIQPVIISIQYLRGILHTRVVTVNHRPDNRIRLIYTSCHRKTVRLTVRQTEGVCTHKALTLLDPYNTKKLTRLNLERSQTLTKQPADSDHSEFLHRFVQQ